MMTERIAHIRARIGPRLSLAVDRLVPAALAAQARRGHCISPALGLAQTTPPFAAQPIDSANALPPSRATASDRPQSPEQRALAAQPLSPPLRAAPPQPITAQATTRPAPLRLISNNPVPQRAKTEAEISATTEPPPTPPSDAPPALHAPLTREAMSPQPRTSTPKGQRPPAPSFERAPPDARPLPLAHPLEAAFAQALARRLGGMAGTAHSPQTAAFAAPSPSLRPANALDAGPVEMAPLPFAHAPLFAAGPQSATTPKEQDALDAPAFAAPPRLRPQDAPETLLRAALERALPGPALSAQILPKTAQAQRPAHSSDAAPAPDDFAFDLRLRAALNRILAEDMLRHGFGDLDGG